MTSNADVPKSARLGATTMPKVREHDDGGWPETTITLSYYVQGTDDLDEAQKLMQAERERIEALLLGEPTGEMVERARHALVNQTCGHDESGIAHWPEDSQIAYLNAIEDARQVMDDILAHALSTEARDV